MNEVPTKSNESVKRFKNKIFELETKISELEINIMELKEESPKNIEDEIMIRLYRVVTDIANCSSKEDFTTQKNICVRILEQQPEDIINEVKNFYRLEGIDKAIALSISKSEQARDLESELTALVAESLTEALNKLKNSM